MQPISYTKRSGRMSTNRNTSLRKHQTLSYSPTAREKQQLSPIDPLADWDVSTADLSEKRPSAPQRQQLSQRNINLIHSLSGTSMLPSAVSPDQPSKLGVLEDLTRDFMHLSTLRFKDMMMEEEFAMKQRHAIMPGLPVKTAFLLITGVALYIVNICQPAFFMTINPILRESIFGSVAVLLVAGITLSQYTIASRHALRTLTTSLLFLFLSSVVAVRHALSSFSIYQTAFLQLSLILAQTLFAPSPFYHTFLVNILILGIFIVESSIKCTSPLEPLTSTIVILASIAFITLSQYQLEYTIRTNFLHIHQVYQMAQSSGQNRRVHSKFNAYLVSNLETPLEKAINIIKAVLEESRLDGMQEKCLLTALEFLAKGDLMLPDLNQNVQVDDEQQAFILANLFQIPQLKLLNAIEEPRLEHTESTMSLREPSDIEAIRKLSTISRCSIVNHVPEKSLREPVRGARSSKAMPCIPKKKGSISQRNASADHGSTNALAEAVDAIEVTEIPSSKINQSLKAPPSNVDLASSSPAPEHKRSRRSSAPNTQLLVKFLPSRIDDTSHAQAAVGIALVATNHVISMLSRDILNEEGEDEFQDESKNFFGQKAQLNNNISSLELSRHVGIVKMLEEVNHWNLDVFELNTLSNGNSLLTLSHYAFLKSNLYTRFKIDQNVFFAFMKQVQLGYHADNPYHNATHATDVLHGVNWLKDRCASATIPTELELLSLYFAAAVHDLAHPGLNNNYLVATSDKMATLYNDRSVLENHHVATAFSLLLSGKGELNFLSNLTRDEFKAFRELAIELVLSTDLQMNHFALMTKFKGKVTSGVQFDPSSVAEDKVLLLKARFSFT